MKLRRILPVCCLIACLFIPVSSQAQIVQTRPLKSFVTGTAVTSAQTISTAQGVFNGVLYITSFAVQNGVLTAIGTLSGTLTNAEGAVLQTVDSLPVVHQLIGMQSTCNIISLTLAPLDVNVSAGAKVHLNQVGMNVAAQGGLGGLIGNLLGNLLCSVSNLLDNTIDNTGLTQIATLLNQILAQI